ncbi:PLP-dependent aminotransferase family protein [Myxococcus stipitatus]|uniref:MocR-like pyridoxine biosynthesis transcription factor PdxR n=1 Tax=Myxococcus stipitatus TaxID=83455 RepID=UPI001F485D27|nr:PLP-dependent aminotransferase family protein [Myxococcus stipitatus]MCE9669841.1 PLP-dependent aminotransferase family protein [Myxococcus stipitatus]
MARNSRSVFSVDVSGLEPSREQSVSARIRDRLRTAIRSGALVGNARLPSSRTLARDFGVARNTVDDALGQLVSEGYIVRRRGSGSFVSPRLPEHDAPPLVPEREAEGAGAAVTRPRLSHRALSLRTHPGHSSPARSIPFTPSLPPLRHFPRDVWRRLLGREAARPGSDYWGYGASNGLPALREAIAAHASAMRAVRCTPEQVVVVTSTQQAVELAGKALADPGDRAWMELPGYPPVRHCLRAVGVDVVDVPVDDEGLEVDAGRRLAPDARLAYVTPAHQYPLGCEMSLARRKALLAWAREAGAYVLEDDYDGDYRYEGRPIASLQGMDDAGRVVYVGSFNKLLFPGLRLAYAIVPEALVGAFIDVKHVADGHTALLTQGVLAAFIQEGHLARHLRRARATYDERRRAFLEEAAVLDPWLEFGPARAGMHVTARFREHLAGRVDDKAVSEACAREGIEVHPLSRYGATGRGGLVFGFAGATRAATRTGLQAVRRVLEGRAQRGIA